jgi:hypothetical protein
VLAISLAARHEQLIQSEFNTPHLLSVRQVLLVHRVQAIVLDRNGGEHLLKFGNIGLQLPNLLRGLIADHLESRRQAADLHKDTANTYQHQGEIPNPEPEVEICGAIAQYRNPSWNNQISPSAITGNTKNAKTFIAKIITATSGSYHQLSAGRGVSMMRVMLDPILKNGEPRIAIARPSQTQTLQNLFHAG